MQNELLAALARKAQSKSSKGYSVLHGLIVCFVAPVNMHNQFPVFSLCLSIKHLKK